MSIKENNNMNEFLSGMSNDLKRNQYIEMLDKINYNNEKEMKRANDIKFDTHKAWNKFYNRLENDGLIDVQKSKKFVLRNFSRIAAAVILLIGLSISGYLVFGPDTYYEISSFTELKEIQLPDGSIVSLNTNSSIKYPKKFNSEYREVEFFGEAFFEVTKDPKKPFIIQTSEANVKVLGTSFNLSSQKDYTELTVTSGKVQLSKKLNSDEKIIVEVGEKGHIKGQKISKEINSDLNYLSWKTKNLYYANEVTLSKVFSDLNKIFHTNIVCNDKEIGQYKLNPTEFINYNSDTILDIIFKIHPLKKEKVGNKIIISKRTD